MNATGVGRALRRLVRQARAGVAAGAAPRCLSLQVRSEAEVRSAAGRLAAGAVLDAGTLQVLVRDLASLNSPALFLHVRSRQPRVRVLLEPWAGRSLRFRGSSFMVEAGSEAPEGVEAFASVPYAQVTALYPTAPDHPVFIVSIEHQAERLIRGSVPAYLTHVSILVNGSLLAHGERLLQERGPQAWAEAV